MGPLPSRHGRLAARLLATWLLAAMLLLAAATSARAERPFSTEEAETLEPGFYSVDAGLVLRFDAVDFGIEDRDRQYDLGALRFSFGLGPITEVQVSGVAQALLSKDGRSSTNSGDWIFGTKIWLRREKGASPALSFLYEVKLPNGSNENGGATDETDFFGHLIASWQRPGGAIHANLGLGILGNPFANAAQNDVFILRLAWERKLTPDRIAGVEAVVEGGPDERDDPAYLAMVFAERHARWVFHGRLALGLNDESDDLRISLGVRRRFRLWKVEEPVRRNSW